MGEPLMSVEPASLTADQTRTAFGRTCIFRSDEEWARIRARYETAQRKIGLRDLAKEYQISPSTVMKRAWREGWKQSKGLISSARKIVEAATDQAIQAAASKAVENAASTLVERLQPLIEREKAHHIETQIKRSNGHLTRLDDYLTRKKPLAPRDEAHLAKAVSTHVLDLRRTLGMNDGIGIGGSLSIQVLTNQAAIAVSQS